MERVDALSNAASVARNDGARDHRNEEITIVTSFEILSLAPPLASHSRENLSTISSGLTWELELTGKAWTFLITLKMPELRDLAKTLRLYRKAR